jgi:hypothetical protein
MQAGVQIHGRMAEADYPHRCAAWGRCCGTLPESLQHTHTPPPAAVKGLVHPPPETTRHREGLGAARRCARSWRTPALAASWLLACAATPAAEIVVYESALQSAMLRQAFDVNGRRLLAGDPRQCNYALVQQPTLRLREGRLFLRAQFSGVLGVPVPSGGCSGLADAFWFEVSGRPAAQGDALGLDDLRLGEVKEVYRPLIESLMSGAVSQALRINLRTELQKMLDGAGGYRASLPMLEIRSVTTSDEAVTLRFDFRLEAR